MHHQDVATRRIDQLRIFDALKLSSGAIVSRFDTVPCVSLGMRIVHENCADSICSSHLLFFVWSLVSCVVQVLADYSSATIDLHDPNSYRDLSKPMGALGPRRGRQYKERYRNMVRCNWTCSSAMFLHLVSYSGRMNSEKMALREPPLHFTTALTTRAQDMCFII